MAPVFAPLSPCKNALWLSASPALRKQGGTASPAFFQHSDFSSLFRTSHVCSFGSRAPFSVPDRKGFRWNASLGAGTSEEKNELLKDAAKSGDLNLIRELVATGEVDLNLPSEARSGWTALHLASFYGHSEVLSYLLWAGADTEVRNNSGNTALQFACIKGNTEIARILLEAGADINAISNDKGTALDYAQEWGGEDMVEFLLQWPSS